MVNPLTLASVAEPQRMWRQFRFALQFAIFATITCFDQPASLEAVRSFFRTKYQPVIDLLTSSRRGFSVGQVAKRSLRQLLFWIFESFGAAQWNQFIGSMRESGNDRFFEENGGVVQHDVLLEFLPYAVDIQNGEFGRLSLEAGSAFRELMLRMIDFRVMSIIGYNATLCLPSVLLRNDWKTIEALIMEIIERRTPSSLFYGNLLLANLSYSDRALAQPCLELMRDRIVPLLLREGLASDWSITFCIATLDVERLWPAFEAILRQLLDHYERTGDAAACSEFGDTLFKICYCHDIALGTRVIEMLVRERSHFLGPLWRECTLKVFGAMLARSPATLRTIFTANGIDESMTRQARGYQSAEIVKQSRLFPMQVDVNRFTAWLYVAEPRLRYPVVKYFIGSLAAGSTVADFATGVRQTLIAFINVFFGEHPNDAPQGRLSVDEIVAAVKPRRAAHRISGRIAPGLRRAGG